MTVTVRLAAPLRAAAGGNTTIDFDVTDLPELASEIADRYPELAARVLRDGTFGRFVNVFIDGEDARFLTESDLRGKRTVEILPAMSGGAVAPLPERARRDEHEVYGSFIDETIGIVARQTRDTVSFAVGSPSREALEGGGGVPGIRERALGVPQPRRPRARGTGRRRGPRRCGSGAAHTQARRAPSDVLRRPEFSESHGRDALLRTPRGIARTRREPRRG